MDVKCPHCGSRKLFLFPKTTVVFDFSAHGKGYVADNVKKNAARNYKATFDWIAIALEKYQDPADCLLCQDCLERSFPLVTDIFIDPVNKKGHGIELLGAFKTLEERVTARKKIEMKSDFLDCLEK